MPQTPEPTIDERVEQYNERLKRRVIKHIQKFAKILQDNRKRLPRRMNERKGKKPMD